MPLRHSMASGWPGAEVPLMAEQKEICVRSNSAVIDAKCALGFHDASGWKAGGTSIPGLADAVASMLENPGTLPDGQHARLVSRAPVYVGRAVGNGYLRVLLVRILRVAAVWQPPPLLKVGGRFVDDPRMGRAVPQNRTDAGRLVPAGAAAVECDQQLVRIATLDEERVLRRTGHRSSLRHDRAAAARRIDSHVPAVRQRDVGRTVQVDLIPVGRSVGLRGRREQQRAGQQQRV